MNIRSLIRVNFIKLFSYLLASKESKVIFYHDIHSSFMYTDMSTPIDVFIQHIQIIRDLVNEPYFIQKYLNRIKTGTEFLDTHIITINLLEENATTIDWIVINKLVNDNWIDFTIFGIEIGNGGEFIKKAFAIIAVGFTIFNVTLRV